MRSVSLRVETHYSGSHCVVWKSREHYLDCRSGELPWGTPVTRIEAVRNGQVYRRKTVLNSEAPEQIVQMMREEFYGRTCV